MSQLSDLLLISGFLPSQITRIADAASQGRIHMKMLVSDQAIFVNVLYAKGFPLQRRRSSGNPATFSLHNLAALDTQSRPPFSILNRTKIASFSPPPGREHILRPSNTLRQQPRNIERRSSLNLGKHEISVVMYVLHTNSKASTALLLDEPNYQNREAPKNLNSDTQISLAPSKTHTPVSTFNSKHINPLVREIKWKK